MVFITGQKLGEKLVQVFGLPDAKNITSITVHADAGSTARVTIVRYLTDEQTQVLATVLEQYQLKLKEG
jgi:hypothetical protein